MRDLQVVNWLNRLRSSDADVDSSLREAREFLSAIRCKLHYKTGRDSNILTFDLQEELAEDAASWMREYYRHARDIHRCAKRQMEASEQISEGGLAKQFREWRSRLSNADFTVSRDRVFFRAPQQIASDPALVLRLFEFVARHGIRLSLEAERRVRDHKLYLEEYFASSRPLWQTLKSLLLLPNAALALRAMHETGLLQIIIPGLGTDRMPGRARFLSPVHRGRTHTGNSRVAGRVESDKGRGRRRFRELLGETQICHFFHGAYFPRPGKERRNEGHAVASARLRSASSIACRCPNQSGEVLFLIEHHLVFPR